MILQKLYNDYNFNVEMLLTQNYRKLNLTSDELIILLVLFSNKAKKKVFSLASISRKVDFNQNEIANIVSSLLEKDFLEINLETNNKHEREIYNLDKTFLKLEEMLKYEINDNLKQANKSKTAETITLLEEKVNRILRPNELERVRLWYDTFNFDHDVIVDAINKANNNVTVLGIEKIVNLSVDDVEEIDKDVDEVLERIYKKV